MKYNYAYKTSDGVRHEASLEAKSREEAFAALRAQGIRAIKVIAADGSKANGEVRGVRKRVVAIGAACLVFCAIIASILSFSQGAKHQLPMTNNQMPLTAPRHQIYGDPAVMEEIDHGKIEAFLPGKGDQMLAWFAQPGKITCPKGIDPRNLSSTFEAVIAEDKNSPLITPHASLLTFSESEAREVRELKQMVNGMREELGVYLANGNGSPRSYWRRLLERTRQENLIYERTKRELEGVKDDAVWEQKNDALRALGLRTIPQPE